ncbi:hypothetical protein LB467_13905 [Salegentibacter sp. JZCK2]|uniref:hypothetical protein n=1 Tax=Salegentibacter tibetensis TaxID=2873600 RepID=UPI001CCC0653|nr:hypothetical protein [Salegentibacter tibetensis]MBZ9730785.1 hypothetical protein [Salegentibacter tibetensis]
MKQRKTSSFIIDLNVSSFKNFIDGWKIYQYSLPAHLRFKKNYFGVLHNWAKSNIDFPYFLHFATRKIYVLYEKGEAPEKYSFEDHALSMETFDGYKDANQSHIWLKVLLAQYMELNNSFISSDSFYIHSELNKDKTWATVLKVNLKHDYKNTESAVFNIEDTATRLRRINREEYKRYYNRDIPYGLTYINGTPFFKQLKKNELEGFDSNIFVRPKPISGNTSKTTINFHSIMDEAHHEKSKSYIIQNFLSKFLKFLSKYDISVWEKELLLERVDKKSDTESLKTRNLKISLIDGRKNRSIPLSELFNVSKSLQQKINITEKKNDKLNPNESLLFVMDYNKKDFKRYYPDEEDPYLKLTKASSEAKAAKQGICINDLSFTDVDSLPSKDYFNYSGINQKDLERNLSICINQLILKSILLSGDYNYLPKIEILKNKLFIYRGKALYLTQGKLQITDIDSFEELEELVHQVTGRNGVLEIFSEIHQYHNPFSKKELELTKFRLIISQDSVIELIDYPERAFYDDNELHNRIKNRNKKRSIAEFRANETSELALEYNEYIDNNIEELSLSYEELKAKYGKGEDGFLKTIFYNHQERKTYADTVFRKFLQENKGIKIKGLKEDGIFATHTGIWFDRSEMQYFVGRTHGYGKFKQDKGFQMKKILVHSGQFNEKSFFPLLNIDFIRFKELTVNPYPFKLIDMKIEMD